MKFMKDLTPEYKALGRAVEAYITSSKAKLSEEERPDFKIYIAYLITASNDTIFKQFLDKFTDDLVKSLADSYSHYISEDGKLLEKVSTYFSLELARRKLRKRNKRYLA